MDVPVMASSQANIVKSELPCNKQLGIHPLISNGSQSSNKVSFGRRTAWKKGHGGIRLVAKGCQSEPVRSNMVETHDQPINGGLRCYVGLPKDAVSEEYSVNNVSAITAGLKAMKLLGVEGVELPVWWGIVEKDAMGKYDWSSYVAIAEMIQKLDLKLHVTLCFHASKQDNIPLPKWVDEIGKSEPSIFFTDKSGQKYKDCLSFATDDSPIFNGKTPTQVYGDFCQSFKSCFMSFMGTTITGISIGLGPDGELRYPSHYKCSRSNEAPSGVGEFQCYDENMLRLLMQHAVSTGNPLWGRGGPHDAPTYDESPYSTGFFRDGGSWESSYGDFFLSWYSNQLINHGDVLLSIASSTFSDVDDVAIYGKLPVMQNCYKTRCHPSELTAGFYNTTNRDAYNAIAEMFSRNSCKMILSGMNMRDEGQAHESLSISESEIAHLMSSCGKHRVRVSGEIPCGLDEMNKKFLADNEMEVLLYQRMGAYFFSPEHFPSFIEFAWSLNQTSSVAIA